MATFMVFGLVVGSLFAAAAALLEPVVLRWRYQARWLWLAAMFGTVCVLATAARSAPKSSYGAALGTTAQTLAVTSDSRDRPHIVPSLAAFITMNPPETFSIRARTAAWQSYSATLDTPLLVLWIAASISLGLWVCAVTIALRQAFDGSTPSQTMPGIDAVVLTRDVGPAAVGTWRQRILLPRWVLDLEPDLYELVLQHERQHLPARDPLLLLSAAMLVVLLPWHAPLWWMMRRLRRAIEYDCDARVLRAHPDVRQYASLLVLVSARRRPSRPSLSLLAHMVFMSSESAFTALRQRIALMTQPPQARRPVRSLAVLAVAMSVALTAVVLPAPPARIGAQPVPSKASPTMAARQTPTDSAIEFRYVIDARMPESGPKPLLHLLRRTALKSDPHAGFTTINVASVSGEPIRVEFFTTEAVTGRARGTDTSRFRTPIVLMRNRDTPPLHIRSPDGDTLLISSAAAVVPAWATKARGVHFVLWGVNSLGVGQR